MPWPRSIRPAARLSTTGNGAPPTTHTSSIPTESLGRRNGWRISSEWITSPTSSAVDLAPRIAKDPNKADDETLAHVGRLGRLEYLNLAGTAVTDAGLAHLKGLTSLGDLDLSNTQVGDAGLAHLKGLTNLRMLPLVGTRVTDDGVLELKHALPWLQILREEDIDFNKNVFRATRNLNFARSQPIRLAWLLLVHRAKLMANRGDNTELIATMNALCDLEANDKDSLRKLARARAECLDILEPDYSPSLSDSERQALRQRCTDRWIAALSLAIEQGFNNVSQLEGDLWDAGVLENLRNHPEFPKLVEKDESEPFRPLIIQDRHFDPMRPLGCVCRGSGSGR